MATRLDEILAHYERLERDMDKQDRREIFGQKVRLAKQDWKPASRQTRLVGMKLGLS